MIKKAIIFDLYGTLIEPKVKSNPYLYLIANCHDNPKSIVRELMMSDFVVVGYIKRLKDSGKLKPTFNYEEFLRLLDLELESVAAIAGVYRSLTKLKEKDYKMYVLSNLATPYKYPYYKLNLENYIEKAFFSCECKDIKPNKSFFQKVIDYSGLKKEDFIMIGDNKISDIKGAEDFGIKDTILRTGGNFYSTIKDLL